MRMSVLVGGALLAVLGLAGAAAAQPPLPSPADFVGVVNNRYFPLVPGRTHVYQGDSEDGPVVLLISVAHGRKNILGVPCLIVSEIESVDGQLVEVAINWFAQDRWGNVWYFGEDSKDYERGRVVSTDGSWQAGVRGAEPGIIMEARPRVGDVYAQEVAPGVAEDMAEVLSLNRTVTVPFGAFNRCLLTREWSPLEPGVEERKFYAPGIGFIAGSGNDLELVYIISDD